MTTMTKHNGSSRMTQWFNVDRRGLAKLMEGRSKAFILYELVQNAWDEAAKSVKITLEPVEGTRNVRISVEDDSPDGFKDISHAYTLFAESQKKADPTKRGRFNMGEKLVLALAKRARIITTTGTVEFDEDGRHVSRASRPSGSIVVIELPMTKAEMHEIIAAARHLIPPPGITTEINGEVLPERRPLTWFQTQLPTLISNEEGVLRRTERMTIVRLHKTAPGEAAMIYEMGIPVVETGDKYHVDVQQKVPLNMDRDGVTPGYLRSLRVAVVNNAHHLLDESDATQTWVKEACSDESLAPEAAKEVFEKRFGDNAVAYDPSDPEANKLSVADGRRVVHGGTLSAAEWQNAKAAGVLPPAGQVTPSPKPYSPDGKPLNVIPMTNWTDGMIRIRRFAGDIAEMLWGMDVVVQFVNDPQWPFNATYGPSGGNFAGGLTFNVGRLGHKFFNNGITDEVIDLLIHEFGHHYSSDHLSREYFDALTLLGAKFTRIALKHPEMFA